jgi:hypothetical protein
MQNPLDQSEEDFAAELRQLRPLPPALAKMDLCYTAGFKAAQRRSRLWHAAAVIAFIAMGSFEFLHPKPQAITRVVDRVVYVEHPIEPAPQPSLAGVLEHRELTEAALQDRWTALPRSGNTTDRMPLIGAWMTDPNPSGDLR